MDYLFLGTFCCALFLCIIFNFSILYALVFGFLLFAAYGIIKGYSIKKVLCFALEGITTVKKILITFVLIGILTAIWRNSGTIATIVSYAAHLISPSVFLLMTFILNSVLSVLTGTAFGTAATMGVICSAIGASIGMPVYLTGGAILSGVYFGDRCSPVSTSALLISTLTDTVIFDNIKNMVRSCAVPFLLTCTLYTAIGFSQSAKGAVPDLATVFGREFSLSPITLIPAIVLLVLSLLRVNVIASMGISIISAVPVCIFVQGTSLSELLKVCVTGFVAKDAEVATMISGGGILSMVRVCAIVCLSSAYSGIFQETGLLDGVKKNVAKLADKTCSYIACLVTSIVTGMIACNQTLSIMLTHQLCHDTENDKSKFALSLEDTATVLAPLIPWSIACGVVFSSVEAPMSSLWFSCFLYILPLWRAITELIKKHKRNSP